MKIFTNNLKQKLTNIAYKFRQIILIILSGIFTLYLSILYAFLYLVNLFLSPLVPHSSHLLLYVNKSLDDLVTQNQPNFQKNLTLLLSSTMSLLMVLLVVGYCETMLKIVQFFAKQTHAVFLQFVIPQIPQFRHFTTNYFNWVSHVYRILSYIGIKAQLALTIDLLYLYNLPTIYIYKILALLYWKILNMLRFSIKLYNYCPQNWLTCPYPQLLARVKHTHLAQIIGITMIIISVQLLIIIGFYYLWLAVVIVLLMMIINIVHNIQQFIDYFVLVILAIKGYEHGIQESADKNDEQDQFDDIQSLDEVILYRIRQIQVNWRPLIKLHDIRDVFVGKDITRSEYKFRQFTNTNLSIFKIFRSFLQAGQSRR